MKRFPDRRTDLYHCCLEGLLDFWKDSSYQETLSDGSIREIALDALYYIGWYLHVNSYKNEGSSICTNEDLIEVLNSYLAEQWEEIHKERQGHVFSGRDGGFDDSYQRLYGASEEALLRRFRDEKGYSQSDDITLDQLQEFTYWLFKYRLGNCDRARVASDTKKGMEYLKRYSLDRGLNVPQSNSSEVIEHSL